MHEPAATRREECHEYHCQSMIALAGGIARQREECNDLRKLPRHDAVGWLQSHAHLSQVLQSHICRYMN